MRSSLSCQGAGDMGAPDTYGQFAMSKMLVMYDVDFRSPAAIAKRRCGG